MSAPTVVILGATSAIAEAAARRWAAEGAHIHLVGRRAERLADIAADLRVRGARDASVQEADLADDRLQASVVATALERVGSAPDVVLVAWGVLPDNAQAVADAAAAGDALRTNFVAPAQYVLRFADAMRARRRGSIVVIGSVAGDIGRAGNFVYGSAKGGLEIFCEGARRYYRGDGVRIVLVKPGFVDTPMTSHLRKGPLFASADAVGRVVHRASRRAAGPIYAPSWWRAVMTLLRWLPRPVMDRLRI
jgi:decaprenylphospho-beta-D-erythro-pentofuranosid-2-ulose 2-reductase